MDLENNKQSNFSLSKTVVLAVIFGFAAGVVGQIVANVYIEPGLQQNQELTNINKNTLSIPEIKPIKKYIGTSQDFAVADVSQKAALNLVSIYLKKAENQELISRVYLEKELLSNGFVLTSDGWLVFPQETLAKYKDNQLIVKHGARFYNIVKNVADPMSGLVFIKIDAKDLPVVTLSDWQTASLGQTVVVLNSLSQVKVSNIESFDYADRKVNSEIIRSSEEFSYFILIKESLDNSFQGALLLNLNGEVLGVIAKQGEVNIRQAVPVNYIDNVFSSVLRQGKVIRPQLGLDYIDLNKEVGLDADKGVLVYTSPALNSPAQKAGIKKGDIILKIEDIAISGRNDLVEIIQSYHVGDKLQFTLSRDGKEKIVEVVLGQQK